MKNNKQIHLKAYDNSSTFEFLYSFMLLRYYAHFHDATLPEEISHLSFLWRPISYRRTSSATSICSKLSKAISRFVTFPRTPCKPREGFPNRPFFKVKNIKCHPFLLWGNYAVFREFFLTSGMSNRSFLDPMIQ